MLRDEAYAWAAALEQAGGDPRHPEPRRALRCLTTLERVHWRRASSTRQAPPAATAGAAAPRHARVLRRRNSIIVGGEHGRARWVHADAFAFDVRAGTWTQAAKATTWPDGDGPRRTFWDTEVGRVNRLVLVTDSAEREWALLYAERASEGAALSQPEETWLLGPLSPAAGAASWQWIRRGAAPTSRAVGYTVNALSHRPGLAVVLGGLDVSERPLLALESLVIQATSDGGVDAHWGAHDVDVIAAGLASFQRPPEPPARAHHAAVEWPGRGPSWSAARAAADATCATTSGCSSPLAIRSTGESCRSRCPTRPGGRSCAPPSWAAVRRRTGSSSSAEAVSRSTT